MSKKVNNLIDEIEKLCSETITNDWGNLWGSIDISVKFQNGVAVFVEKKETRPLKK